MNLIDKIESIEIIGATKLNGDFRFFVGTVAEFIMDYLKNDPNSDPEEMKSYFREGLIAVDESNAQEYINVMQKTELNIDNFQLLRKKYGRDRIYLAVLIDFDEKKYINGYYDLFLESYIPNNWVGVEGDPVDYLPEHLKIIFA